MLPQFGYIVAQAGADSRPSPSPSMYTTAATTNAPRSSPPPPAPPPAPPLTLQQQQQPTITHSTYILNAPPPPLHHQQQQQKITYQHGLPPPPQQPLYPSYPTGSGAPWIYSTTASASIHDSAKTEYHTQYYSSNYDRSYPTTTTTVPPPPPLKTPPPHSKLPPPSMSKIWQQTSSIPPKSMKKSISPMLEHVNPPPPPTSRWHQEDLYELNDNKMLRRLRECNDVMEWMDHDYREQRDEMYHEKHLALQKELKNIQDGDHAVFQEQVADLEMEREQTISAALCFATYQQTMAKQDLDMDIMMIEEDYKEEKRHLDETLLLLIDEYKRNIKDNRGDADIKGLFDQVPDRVLQKKQLRKRTATTATTAAINGTGGSGNTTNGINLSSNRQETSTRGRRLKNTTGIPHNINAPISLQEDEDMESEYLNMKGTISKRSTTTSKR